METIIPGEQIRILILKMSQQRQTPALEVLFMVVMAEEMTPAPETMGTPAARAVRRAQEMLVKPAAIVLPMLRVM